MEVALDGAKRVVMQNPHAEFRDVVYSPDGKWLAYSKPAENQFGVVYVYNLASGREYAVGTTPQGLSSAPTASICFIPQAPR